MAITPLNTDLNFIATLDDEPNDVDGLASDELKARFDQAGNTIKGYLNDTLIPQLEAATLPYQYGSPATIKETVDGIVLGQVPDGSITTQKLGGDVLGALEEKADADTVVRLADKATTEEAEAGEDDTKWMTPEKTATAIEHAPSTGLVRFDGELRSYRQVARAVDARGAAVLDGRGCITPDKTRLVMLSSSTVRLVDLGKKTVLGTVSVANGAYVQASDDFALVLTGGGTAYVFSISNTAISLVDTISGMNWQFLGNTPFYVPNNHPDYMLFVGLTGTGGTYHLYRFNKTARSITLVTALGSALTYENTPMSLPIGEHILFGRSGGNGSATSYELSKVGPTGTKTTILTGAENATSKALQSFGYLPETNTVYSNVQLSSSGYFWYQHSYATGTQINYASSSSRPGMMAGYEGKLYRDNDELNPITGTPISGTMISAFSAVTLNASGIQFTLAATNSVIGRLFGKTSLSHAGVQGVSSAFLADVVCFGGVVL